MLESIWTVLPKSNVFLKFIGFPNQIFFVNWRFDGIFRIWRIFYTISILFQRKTEFRKLCDKLRNHLDLVLKQSTSPLTINLNNADTQQMNLDTRLVQLGKFLNYLLFRRRALFAYFRLWILIFISVCLFVFPNFNPEEIINFDNSM